jgi:hypothetical protein
MAIPTVVTRFVVTVELNIPLRAFATPKSATSA